jgi:hypothetical protein
LPTLLDQAAAAISELADDRVGLRSLAVYATGETGVKMEPTAAVASRADATATLRSCKKLQEER